MGIHRLEKFLVMQGGSSFSTSVSSLRSSAGGQGDAPLVLICDGNALVHTLIEMLPFSEAFPFPSIYGGEFAELRRTTLTFVAAWRLCGVEISVCFDSYGGPVASAAKASEAAKRFEEKIADAVAVETYCREGSLPRANRLRTRQTTAVADASGEGGANSNSSATSGLVSLSVPAPSPSKQLAAARLSLKIPLSKASAEIKDALRTARVSWLHADGEADGAVVRAAAAAGARCIGVLSQDTDFCVYGGGVSYVPLKTLQIPQSLLKRARELLISGGWRSSNIVVGEGIGTYDISLDVYTRESVARLADVPERLFVDAAILAGNDYTRNAFASVMSDELRAELGFEAGDDDFALIAARVRELCGDAEEGGGATRKRAVEDLPVLGASLQRSPALTRAFAFSRAVYAHATPAQGPRAALVSFFAGEKPSALSPPNSLARRLATCTWTRSLYSALELGVLSIGDTQDLEEPNSLRFGLGIEPVPFDADAPSSFRVRLPFIAVKTAWQSGGGVPRPRPQPRRCRCRCRPPLISPSP